MKKITSDKNIFDPVKWEEWKKENSEVIVYIKEDGTIDK